MSDAPAVKSRRARRRRVLRLAAALIGVSLALVVAEVALRVAGVTAEPRRHFSPGIFRADPELKWALAPSYRGTYRNYTKHTEASTNAAGFRGAEWEPGKDAALRVVALGDSCTYGMGVAAEDAYPALLEGVLSERGQDAAVFNLGVMGYDTHQEAVLLDRVADELTPQVVVLGWLPNDATDLSVQDQTLVREGYLVKDEEEFRKWRDRSQRRGINGSVLYRVLRVRGKELKNALGMKRGNAWRPDWLDAEAMAPSLASLSRIHARCEAIGAKLVVLFFPRREEVDGQPGLEHYDHVRAHAEGLGATVVDIPHAWREQRPEGELYLFRDNTHLTRIGYADVARRIADAILED